MSKKLVTEEEIRPDKIFKKYLKLCKEDSKKIFKDKKNFEQINCPVCDLPGKKIFTKSSFTYKECSNCLTIFVSPRPTKKMYDRYYRDSKSANFWATDFYPLTAESRREKLWKPKVKLILNMLKKNRANNYTIVEVGGGYGIFAEEIKKICSNKIILIEPSKSLANELKKKKIKVIEKFLEDIVISDLPKNKKLFICFELFEHLQSPEIFLKKLYKLMKKNELLYFTTLSGTGIDIRTLWKNSQSVSPPHHINFLNPNSVSMILKKIGFSKIETSTPGQLDLDIMFKNKSKIKDNFWLNFLNNSTVEDRNKMQSSISDLGLSSHMHIMCKK